MSIVFFSVGGGIRVLSYTKLLRNSPAQLIFISFSPGWKGLPSQAGYRELAER
jgi:hypothetical protein